MGINEIVGRCQAAVPGWENAEGVTAEVMPSGSNTVYVVQASNQTDPAKVVYREFGSHGVTNSATERTLFQFLGDLGIGPKTYVCTATYRVEEFIAGRTLRRLELKEQHFIELVCATLRAFHAVDVSSVLPLDGDTPTLVHNCARWRLKAISECPDSHTPEISSILSDAAWVQFSSLLPTQEPLVFCHHDCYCLNFLYTGTRTRLLDFEHSGYGYRSMDLAFTLNELQFDYQNPDPPYLSQHPEDRFTTDLITAYVTAYGGGTDLWVGTRLGLCYGHYVWAVWALAMWKQGRAGFDYVAYGQIRYAEFQREWGELGRLGGIEGVKRQAEVCMRARSFSGRQD